MSLDLASPAAAHSPASFPDWRFDVLRFEYDPGLKTAFLGLAADGVPSFTPRLSRDMARLCASFRALGGLASPPEVRYVATTSPVPGVFSMGGDLAYFADCIEAGNREALSAYARNAVDVFHEIWTGFGMPVVTFALVDGDALGGGYETALVHNFCVAEGGVRMGLPEVTFDIFPGMGAVSFLRRRLGAARAKEIILGGGPMPAEKLHGWGGVDWLAPVDGVRSTFVDLIEGGAPEAHARWLEARDRRTSEFGVSREEMRDIVDLWVDGAMRVGPPAVTRMRRVAAVQRRQTSSRASG